MFEIATSAIGYKEIAARLIEEIEKGKWQRGQMLSASREYADVLGVSRDTVVRAYKYLQDLDYVQTDKTRGTFVKHGPSEKQLIADSAEKHVPTRAVITALKLSRLGQKCARSKSPHNVIEACSSLNYGAIHLSDLPLKKWREYQLRDIQASQSKGAEHVDLVNSENLQESLRRYLFLSRQIDCREEDIAVFNSKHSVVELICKLLLEPGDGIVVEDPGCGLIRNIADQQNLSLLPLPVDREGLIVENITSLRRAPKLVYVSPASHNPTGVVMSLARRQSLLEWCKRNDAWIIEDDSDNYFNYSRRQMPSLKSLDMQNSAQSQMNEVVIYLSSFWQILYPLTSSSFVVLPKSIVSVVANSRAGYYAAVDALTQLILSEFLRDGILSRRVRSLQKIFAHRLQKLTLELTLRFGSSITMSRQVAGLNCVVGTLKWTEEEVLLAAKHSGMPLVSLADYSFERSARGQYLINFASISEDSVYKMVEDFAQNLRCSNTSISR